MTCRSSISPEHMNTSDPWAFFDHIFCISLLERGDRREAASRQFAAVGLGQRVEFVLVARHPLDREEGIYASHMRCLKLGLEQGARRMLVFEDDVFFRRCDVSRLHHALRHLETLPAWHGFFLGCLTEGSSATAVPSLVSIKYRSLAHAYALNAPFARQLVQLPWRGIPFDELLHRHCNNSYALFPMCAFQGLLGSDNQRVIIAHFRHFCGGLPLIQRCCEWYQRHKPLLIVLHIALLGLAGALLCRMWYR